MHELKRRAYLDAMGIATYVSRAQLSGAAPTAKLRVARQRPAVSLQPTPQAPADVVHVPQIPSVDLSGSRGTARAPRSPIAARRPPDAAVVEFGIAAFVTGDWLWLEEQPLQQALLRDQVLLVQSIAQALGWGSGKPELSQFKWPIHTNSQLDLGEDAARASLGGFISRKREREACSGLVLLGRACASWVPADQIDTGLCVRTISTIEMLRAPDLKKQAWRDLLPHAARG